MSGNYLITTDGWFFAPDGKQYRAAWGKIKEVKSHTGDHIQVGSESKHVIISASLVNYSVRCEDEPNVDWSEDWQADAQNGAKVFNRPSSIYIAQ